MWMWMETVTVTVLEGDGRKGMGLRLRMRARARVAGSLGLGLRVSFRLLPTSRCEMREMYPSSILFFYPISHSPGNLLSSSSFCDCFVREIVLFSTVVSALFVI